MTTKLSKQILSLRELGYSYNKISKELGCSKSTVSYWCCGDRNNQERIDNYLPHNFCPCGKRIKISSSVCVECYLSDIPISVITYGSGPRANAFTKIRARAKKIVKADGRYDKGCEKCGYNLHVEVCHKKPISSFSPDTLLSIVNHKDNLLVLCPNCHWEFDHPKYDNQESSLSTTSDA